MSAALLPGIAPQPKPADRSPGSTGGSAPRARREHFRGMRADVAEIAGGLRVFFRTSGEAWFWRDVGGGLFEEAERLSGPVSVPTTDG